MKKSFRLSSNFGIPSQYHLVLWNYSFTGDETSQTTTNLKILHRPFHFFHLSQMNSILHYNDIYFCFLYCENSHSVLCRLFSIFLEFRIREQRNLSVFLPILESLPDIISYSEITFLLEMKPLRQPQILQSYICHRISFPFLQGILYEFIILF